MTGSLIALIGGSMIVSGVLLFVVKMRTAIASVMQGPLALGVGLVIRQQTHETGWLGGHWWLGVLLVLLTCVGSVVRSNVDAGRSGFIPRTGSQPGTES